MANHRVAVLSLYKPLLKEAEKFPSYMYRTYALRRIKDAFKKHKYEKEDKKIEELINEAKINLEIIKRQVIIGELFRGPETFIEQHSKESKKS